MHITEVQDTCVTLMVFTERKHGCHGWLKTWTIPNRNCNNKMNRTKFYSTKKKSVSPKAKNLRKLREKRKGRKLLHVFFLFTYYSPYNEIKYRNFSFECFTGFNFLIYSVRFKWRAMRKMQTENLVFFLCQVSDKNVVGIRAENRDENETKGGK